jgi:hypothetical protein
MSPLPTAREVKLVLGSVDIGTHRVTHHDDWGDERFPWRVLGPADAEGFRETLEEFPRYRDAVAFAKRKQKT